MKSRPNLGSSEQLLQLRSLVKPLSLHVAAAQSYNVSNVRAGNAHAAIASEKG